MKINLGSGNRPINGYVNIDIQEKRGIDLLHDVTNGLPFPDSTVDEVRAYDFLEHIPLGKQIFVIEEIWRVLKPEGKFESFTPDAEFGQGAFQDPTHLSFWCENSWLYYSDPAYRALYGIKANFKIEQLVRSCPDRDERVYHLHIIAKAVKPGEGNGS